MKKNKSKGKAKDRSGSESVAVDENNSNITTVTKAELKESMEFLDLEPEEISEQKLRKIIRHVQGNHRTHRGNHRAEMQETITACTTLLYGLLHGMFSPDVDYVREEEELNINAWKRKHRKQRRNAAELAARREKWRSQRDKREKQYKKEEQREGKLAKMLESMAERMVRVHRHREKAAEQRECERDILRRRHYERIRKRLNRLRASKQRHKDAVERLELRLADSEDESSESGDSDSEDDAISLTASDIAFFETLEQFKIVVCDDEEYDSGDEDDDEKGKIQLAMIGHDGKKPKPAITRRFPGGLKERANVERYKEIPDEYGELWRILSFDMEQADFTGSFRPIYDRLDQPVAGASFARICAKFQTKAFVDWHFELQNSTRIAMSAAVLSRIWFVPDWVIVRIDFPPYYRSDERMAPSALVTLYQTGCSSGGIGGVIEEVNDDRKCVYVSMKRHAAQTNKNELTEGNKFDVYVTSSMFGCTSVQRAIDFSYNLKYGDFLFPQIDPNDNQYRHRSKSEIRSLHYEDGGDYNETQKAAIYEIARGDAAYPFVLFGPPGTGKTTVLVESVHQILYENPYARILICAPSGRAADVIAERILVHGIVDPAFIFRLNSLHSKVKERNRRLDCISCLSNPSAVAAIDRNEERLEGDFSHFFAGFKIPALSRLKRYRIIVCTLAASSYLVSGRMPRSHFTHIIIDEAGQCTEPESWIPITGLAGKDTRVVLSGDPKQLGPITNFRLADRLGCNTSMLERLSNLPAYKTNQQLMVMLTDCYRCHPAIIRLPSEMFYDNKLRAFRSGDYDQSYRRLANWPVLPPKAKNFPIIFHDITRAIGWEEQTEMGSKSYCNMAEMHKVCDYVRMILHDKIATESEIGVVSPYKLQIEKLRKELKPYPHIVIDSVERFQGSERRVIVMTTVRTEALGFVRDPQRFNTAITRAKNLLIVVGNGDALWRGSKHWQKFIAYCEERGGFFKD